MKSMDRPTYAVSVVLYPGSARIWQAILKPAGQRVRTACALSPRAAGLRVLRLWMRDEKYLANYFRVNTPEVMARFVKQCNAL